MLKRFWADHRWECLLSLALLVIGVVVSPWWLLAAVVPVGWVLLKIQRSQEEKSTKNLPYEEPEIEDIKDESFIIPEEIKDLLSSSDSTEILQGLELLASTTNLISSFKDPNEDQDIEETIVQIIKEGIHSKELLEFLVSLDSDVIHQGIAANRNSTEEIFLKLSKLLDREISKNIDWEISKNIVSSTSAPREVVLKLITSKPDLLEFALEKFQADQEIVLSVDKQNGWIDGLIESQLCINDGDKILLLLFEGYNECLQEIQLKDHKHDNSQFFIEDFGEPVVIGCYFYLPNDQNKLKEYCLKGPFDKWIIECDEEYVEIVKEKKHLVPIQPSYYEVKYPDGYNNGSYEDVYQKNNNRYLKIEGNPEYDWGNDNFTVYTAIENLIRAIYINSESYQKYEIIELGSQPMSKLKEMKIIDA